MQALTGLSGLSGLVRGFSPEQLSGLKLWLKADAITGPNDGDPVTTWPDSSGNGNDATQATAAKKPTYKAGIQNGRPVIRFDGVDDILATPSVTMATAFTLFAVASRPWNTAKYAPLLGCGYDSAAGKGLFHAGGTTSDWVSKDIVLFGDGFSSGRAPRAI